MKGQTLKTRWYSRFFPWQSSSTGPSLVQDAKKKGKARPKILAKLPSRYLVDVDPAVSVTHTYGMVRFTVHEATLHSACKGRDYFCTVSIGKQALLSTDRRAVAASSATLAFDAGSEFVLQKGGASIARVAIFRRGRLDGALANHLIAWCEVDLAAYFEGPSSDNVAAAAAATGEGPVIEGTFDLVDPENSTQVVGTVLLSGHASTLEDLEKQVWERLLLLADWDGNGALSESEFGVLMHAFGSDIAEPELSDLFKRADLDGQGSVDVTELARVLSFGDADAGRFSRFLRCCPVDGAELSTDPSQSASNVIYVWLALASAESTNGGGGRGGGFTHEADLKGGFHTETQAASSWMLRLSEWAFHPVQSPTQRRKRLYRPGGLRVGEAAAHILVFNRQDRRVEEEALSPVLTLAMRTMYQSQAGKALLRRSGMRRRLTAFSVKEGKYRDSTESAKDIRPFVASFRGQIDVDEAELPLDAYKTFNEFFYRKLKPGCRPVALPDHPNVIVSAADCRLQVFESLEDATRFWIKGKNFSIAGLLADTDPDRTLSKIYSGGTMAIFRLAPQDYHRFHSPVTGTIVSITDVPGDLLTVNPIAVNCAFCDVFTVNKRSVALIHSPLFGKVAFVAVGATLVGSIAWTKKSGDIVQKGDELGYFAFGGSTCIALFSGGSVMWDADLLSNGRKSLESLVKVGERVGLSAASPLKERGGTIGAEQQEKEDAERRRVMLRTETLTSEAGVVPLEERPDLKRMMSGEVEALETMPVCEPPTTTE